MTASAWLITAGALLAPLHAGLILGGSLIAARAKFRAAIDLPTALDVGRHTFRALLRVEFVLAVLLVTVSLTAAGLARGSWPALGLGLVVGLQFFSLRPALDLRARQIIAGGSPPPSQRHALYVALEFTKLALLGWAAAENLLRLAGTAASAANGASG